MRYLLIFLIPFLFVACKNQSDKRLIENWKSYPVPDDHEILYKAGHSDDNWTVFVDSNKVHVVDNRMIDYKSKLPFIIKATEKEVSDLRGTQSVMETDGGYLVGFYRGEWGGSLYWFSKNGEQHYKISGDAIVKFIKRDSNIYAIQGLDHLGPSFGSIVKIENVNGTWTASNYLALSSAPVLIMLDKQNNFVIVTSKDLLQVDTNGNIKTLVEKGLWYYWNYPNSIVILNNQVFIGMRKGVAKYDLASGSQEWLLPD